MAIFVSEPGRPVGTRLPEIFRGRRVGGVEQTGDMDRLQKSSNEATDAEFIQAREATARRAVHEYGEASESGPDTQRAYLPVARICSPSLHTLPAESSLAAALTEMDSHGVHHLVITASDYVAGLVDARWILGWLHSHARTATAQSFQDMELPAFLTASPETDAHQLARLMLAHQLNAALVIDSAGHPEGIVTSTDYLRLYASLSQQEGSV